MGSAIFEGMMIHKAVYWAPPTNDGWGKPTFADPVEIDCRWEDTTKVFVSKEGKESISQSIVFTEEGLATDGYLWKGEEADLDSEQGEDPRKLDDAYVIRSVAAIPGLDGTITLYEAIL